jgi:2-desacetyl-2-hydroxyethyl bacteriochlorophyllide A dehydrogenase
MPTCKALLVTGVDEITVGKVEIPNPELGQVLVKAQYSCISPGTELRCLAGTNGNVTGYPYIPGYAMTGEVIATGPGTTLQEGARVFAKGTVSADGVDTVWGGHIELAVVDEVAVSLVPDNVSLYDASFGALAAIAYHGFALTDVSAGETVAVVGLGPLGQLSARYFLDAGAEVVACDLVERRVAVAKAAGVKAVQVQTTPKEALAEVLPDGADIVVDVTGAAQVLPLSAELVRELPWDEEPTTGSRLMIQGSYADTFTLPYNFLFFNEVGILIPRNYKLRDRRAFLDLLAAGRISVAGLSSGEAVPIEAAPEVYKALRKQSAEALTTVFSWA